MAETTKSISDDRFFEISRERDQLIKRFTDYVDDTFPEQVAKPWDGRNHVWNKVTEWGMGGLVGEVEVHLEDYPEISKVALSVVRAGLQRQHALRYPIREVHTESVDVVGGGFHGYPSLSKDVLLRVTNSPRAVYFNDGENLLAIEPGSAAWVSAESLVEHLIAQPAHPVGH